ncbi:helix-turn-helix domain-containing protein [Streptomyces mirabilis]|uniref:helix-turn-helix domain-containing protein n=1 Tax=Streptomyces mirabilis TaxID=68239 RepID=UPI00366407FD
MNSKDQLGRFLRTRRAQLRPADVGLSTFGERRRVPGLRRDELAQLAGVSQSYYTRLEQGLSLNASVEVLDAIARALRLDETEHRHLHDLAGVVRKSGRSRSRRPAPERVSEATRQLIAAFGDTPVIVLGRRSDVLAWNRTGHALFAGHLDPDSPEQPARRPNTARLVFLDPHTRDLYEDWQRKARDAVGKLRLAVGEHPDDPELAELIGQLTMKSPEFTSLWSEHRVRAWDIATHRMRHPLVGPMDVAQQAMPVPNAPGQRIVAVTAAAGSSSQAALTLLAQVTAPTDAVSRTRATADTDSVSLPQ